MGTLNALEARSVRRWDLAVRAWKKEKSAGGSALLAEGVLFDCLSRLRGILTDVLTSERAVPYFLDLAAQRPKRASQAFQAALKIDLGLTEATFRDARIRAEKDADARRTLERLGGETGLIAYLAAMSRAEAASRLNDAPGARHWYERAAALLPNAPAPKVGLASLAPGSPVDLASLDRTDPYYSYPCVVLTEPIDRELSRRINK